MFASLPIIILVMTIAREGGEQSGTAEHDLLRFGLKAAIGVYIALVLTSSIIHYTGLIELMVTQP